jgi:hypothetical protein
MVATADEVPPQSISFSVQTMSTPCAAPRDCPVSRSLSGRHYSQRSRSQAYWSQRRWPSASPPRPSFVWAPSASSCSCRSCSPHGLRGFTGRMAPHWVPVALCASSAVASVHWCAAVAWPVSRESAVRPLRTLAWDVGPRSRAGRCAQPLLRGRPSPGRAEPAPPRARLACTRPQRLRRPGPVAARRWLPSRRSHAAPRGQAGWA